MSAGRGHKHSAGSVEDPTTNSGGPLKPIAGHFDQALRSEQRRAVLPEFTSRDPIAFLGELLRTTEHREVTPVDVVYVLRTMARELLPKVPHGRRCCPQAVLVGDWIVHERLDRSAPGQAAIAVVAEALSRHGSNGLDNKWLEEQVNRGVSFGALRLELLAIARHYRLPETWFASWERWQLFGRSLAFEVSGRPVVLPLGGVGAAAEKARARIRRTALDSGHHPAAMMLTLGSDGRLWWQIKTADTTVIVVQALLGGFRPDDFPTPAGWRSPFEPGEQRPGVWTSAEKRGNLSTPAACPEQVPSFHLVAFSSSIRR